MSATPLRLPARLEGIGRRLIAAESGLLRSLVEGFGSPCHLVFPDALAERGAAFDRVFREAGVAGRIYFAAKANKSQAFLEAAARCGIGADIASRQEMSAALMAGLRGEDLMVTGPDKGSSLHRLALRHRACIAVDSVEELQALVGLMEAEDHQEGRVVLRHRTPAEVGSRFGMTANEVSHALGLLASAKARLTLEGFSVHLSGYDVGARARAGAGLAAFCEAAREHGLRPTLIDLGGGWPVRYVGGEDWDLFNDTVTAADFHAQRRFEGFYPYHAPIAGHEALRACLAAPLAGGGTLAGLCARGGLTVAIEPGRALLDGAGLTAFRVRSVKARDDGYSILGVEGQSFSLSEQWFSSEFLPDPILLPREPRPAGLVRACVAGASCLDADMLTWRKVAFPVPPLPGDLLIYANTAGYQMDSNESPFHRSPLPRKLALWHRCEGLRWCEDDLFCQADWHPPAIPYDRSPADDHHPRHGLDRLHAIA
ncbi:type III PLP-dependent enzyme domain-containing protein [Microvirga pudoricolor]|uniref:hypothetical protein n=1 Tax=Microvirga pudoricolor TaxID=2778729 RepID=UPI00195161BD|nr:hypothetical protein [Microvirga pudoricolor]MBM6593661.1 hypothetical protein [Microvirga pudoricolor]